MRYHQTMVEPNVFYKRIKAKDIPAAVMSESAVFNNVLAPASIRKVYDALRSQGYLLQRVSLSNFTKYILSPEMDLFRELHLVRKSDGKDVGSVKPEMTFKEKAGKDIKSISTPWFFLMN